MLNIVVAIKKWCDRWAGYRGRIHCDNLNSVLALQTGRARNGFMQSCAGRFTSSLPGMISHSFPLTARVPPWSELMPCLGSPWVNLTVAECGRTRFSNIPTIYILLTPYFTSAIIFDWPCPSLPDLTTTFYALSYLCRSTTPHNLSWPTTVPGVPPRHSSQQKTALVALHRPLRDLHPTRCPCFPRVLALFVEFLLRFSHSEVRHQHASQRSPLPPAAWSLHSCFYSLQSPFHYQSPSSYCPPSSVPCPPGYPGLAQTPGFCLQGVHV